ncbi:MAG: hypothetical protein R3356_01040 [Eudoraea sp.]|nr:hypothetical protein [Eudoraea sp.]
MTQRFADSINFRGARSHSQRVEANNIPIPPRPPMAVAFDYKYSQHFLVEPEEFILYTFPDEFKNDSIVSSGISNIYRIDRINKKMSIFYPSDFETYHDQRLFGYKDDNRFKLIEENKNKRREICGFDCYQVLVRDMNTNRPVEMYVTEEILLEYHPVFNVKKYLAKYYPLYIKFYDSEFPNDYFREYMFYKFK